MKTYTCKAEGMRNLAVFFAENISDKLERLVEESSLDKLVRKVILWTITESLYIPNSTDIKIIAKVKTGEAQYILWFSFEKEPLTGMWKTVLKYDVCPRGKTGSDARISLEEYFQDILNPTEIELEDFEMLTGHSYMLSSKFFEGLCSGQPFDAVARSVPDKDN